MYFVMIRDKEDAHRPHWEAISETFATHDLANDYVLSQIANDNNESELGRWEYCVAKTWTTYKAYGA